MPTVARFGGFSVMIYTTDHLPAQVHVKHGGTEIVVIIETGEVRDKFGMGARLVREAVDWIVENRTFLQSEWDRIDPTS